MSTIEEEGKKASGSGSDNGQEEQKQLASKLAELSARVDALNDARVHVESAVDAQFKERSAVVRKLEAQVRSLMIQTDQKLLELRSILKAAIDGGFSPRNNNGGSAAPDDDEIDHI
jgi:hypothetical protein